ncbi:hypothetical protein conserved [Entamoeba histolytica]|uniref:VWFA domain-containing protein n=3 Tax=Entamoeba histolytica TaxID=5759 RepID=C4M008_ENTH1|nr:hypothetical protein, conserved [Entamoeba histolytica HM-1:IMSS]EAL49709.1 hypothetical protein, conserved [Entamoeba histolytica HM-1:IMSS]EMD43757.1 copine, putative [Entamoeba histolytica KU27]GAT94474.1 hypothetical protein conserved [Entamoeba histolytica]|eukprot:XP_655096.1 hypothetical protein, conserved [Entamoeba histolytica HM-1:IMSS]
MGNTHSSPTNSVLQIKYQSIEEIENELNQKDIKDVTVFIGIDYTSSNVDSGKKTYGGKNLHLISEELNPYQEVISIISKYLKKYTKEIYLYSFGDSISRGNSTCNMNQKGEAFQSYEEVLETYKITTPLVTLSGPTNISPLIEKAIEKKSQTLNKTVVILLCDGQVTDNKTTIKTIKKASGSGIEVICIGIGDGPFETFRNEITENSQNFHFIEYSTLSERFKEEKEEKMGIATLQYLVNL